MIAFLVAALATTLQTGTPDSVAPTAVAARATGPIQVDGRVDEAAWNGATPITSFTQRDPNTAEPSAERSEVRIVYDGEAIFIGARLYDSSGRPGSRR